MQNPRFCVFGGRRFRKMDILDTISTWSVLKWVILVLIAGFIGQFGRMMAEAIMTRMRRRRQERPASPEDTRAVERRPVSSADLPPVASLPSAASGEGSDKKARKALVKARKKETRNKFN